MYLKRVVDFQFVHLFSCYEDESHDFQAPYLLGRKPGFIFMSENVLVFRRYVLKKIRNEVS